MRGLYPVPLSWRKLEFIVVKLTGNQAQFDGPSETVDSFYQSFPDLGEFLQRRLRRNNLSQATAPIEVQYLHGGYAGLPNFLGVPIPLELRDSPIEVCEHVGMGISVVDFHQGGQGDSITLDIVPDAVMKVHISDFHYLDRCEVKVESSEPMVDSVMMAQLVISNPKILRRSEF